MPTAQIVNVSSDVYTVRYIDLSNKYLGNLDDPYTDVAANQGNKIQWRFRDAGDGNLWLENAFSKTYFAAKAGEGAYFTSNTSEATRFTIVSNAAYEKYIESLTPLDEETEYSVSKDVTDFVKNASMATGVEEWYTDFHLFYTSGNPAYQTPTSRASVNEAYRLMGGISQTISGLTPNGLYRFSIPAFYRAASNEICADAADAGFKMGNAYFYGRGCCKFQQGEL